MAIIGQEEYKMPRCMVPPLIAEFALGSGLDQRNGSNYQETGRISNDCTVSTHVS